jgi:hypothetical protein
MVLVMLVPCVLVIQVRAYINVQIQILHVRMVRMEVRDQEDRTAVLVLVIPVIKAVQMAAMALMDLAHQMRPMEAVHRMEQCLARVIINVLWVSSV